MASILFTVNVVFLPGLEAVARKDSNLNVKRLRLSHVRRIARTGSRLGSEVIADHRIVGEEVAKSDANNTSCEF